MAAPITPLAVAALALLAERPMHPYEMYQVLIVRAEDRIIKVKPGSLYHTVDRLEAAGLVRATGTAREGNRPERTTYETTEKGQLALSERLASMLATPAEEYPEFTVAIAEAHNLPRDAVLDLLARRIVSLRGDLAFLEHGHTDVAAKAVEQKFWLDITYQQAMIRAQIDWIERFCKQLESGEIPW